MTAKDILAFQFGRADAIRTVASSSSAIWTGSRGAAIESSPRPQPWDHVQSEALAPAGAEGNVAAAFCRGLDADHPLTHG